MAPISAAPSAYIAEARQGASEASRVVQAQQWRRKGSAVGESSAGRLSRQWLRREAEQCSAAAREERRHTAPFRKATE